MKSNEIQVGMLVQHKRTDQVYMVRSIMYGGNIGVSRTTGNLNTDRAIIHCRSLERVVLQMIRLATIKGFKQYGAEPVKRPESVESELRQSLP